MNTTPGPWKFDRANDGLIAYRIAGDGLILAEVLFRRTIEHAPIQETAQANARLIAAAPALLEVCGDLLELVTTLRYGHENVAHRARQAISQATGNPPVLTGGDK